MEGTSLADNVRLAHLLCNQRDYGWRMKINAMLGKRMSLEEIAAHLNAQKVPPIHGTNRWTAPPFERHSFPSERGTRVTRTVASLNGEPPGS